jgi:DNA processing protein
VTVVVEAGFKSGAVNTATQALELGRVVAGVPGRIDDPTAAGVNLLIRDGAQVITDVEDLLGLYGLSTNAKTADWRDGWGGAGGDGEVVGPAEGDGTSVRAFAWQALQRELSGQ